MRYFILILLLATFESSAQIRQFQGEIAYVHLFNFKQPGLDSIGIMRSVGSSSNFIFKNGSYKWTINNGAMTEEYYSGETFQAYDKYEDSDTLFYVPDSPTDTLIRYNLIPNADTICGYVCDRLQVVIGDKDNKEVFLLRNISFSRDLPLDPEKFKGMTTFCAYEIYKITRSVHLRIEMIAEHWPFVMCYQGIRVDHRPVTAKEIAIPQNAILKN